MSNLDFNNQYNMQKLPVMLQAYPQDAVYSPNMQGIPPSMQGLDYDTFKNQAKDNALAQATKDYDAMSDPTIIFRNFLLALGMSVGVTGATNWLMNSKEIASGATNLQNFQKTRLYKVGEYLDDKVGNSAFGRFIGRVNNGIRNFIGKVPVPEFLKEVQSKVKVGSIAVLDKQGMYSLGKGAEALNEFVEKLSQVPNDKLKDIIPKNAQKEVFELLHKFKAGKIRGPVVWEKLNKVVDLGKIPADKLAKILGPSSFWDKLLLTKPDLNTSLNKARFFNNLSKQGPMAKFAQKMTALIGEASGNGVLGGKMALLMGAAGLITGFNAASNAEKGDKLKAFMEDYIGFTLGSYLMSFVVGTWFNKFLGVSELGLDKNAVKAVGERLGLDMSQGRLQDAVIAYNREYKNVRGLNSIANDLRDGKMSLSKAISKAQKLGIEGAEKIKNPGELLSEIQKVVGARDENYFDSIRKDIKGALKSKLTISSIFKETEHNKGNFLQRLGRYIVQKPLSLIGRALSVGRYDLVHGEKFSAKSMLKWGKRFGGGAGRALLVMFVLVEPFRKGFMKLSHMIFGKPKNSFLDQEKNEKEKAEAEKQTAQNADIVLPQQAVQTANNSAESTNILNNIINKPQSATPAMTSSLLQNNPQTSKIISSAPIAQIDNVNDAPELKRSYIPSAAPSVYATQKDPREAEVERAIFKAEMAERAAQEFLARGF